MHGWSRKSLVLELLLGSQLSKESLGLEIVLETRSNDKRIIKTPHIPCCQVQSGIFEIAQFALEPKQRGKGQIIRIHPRQSRLLIMVGQGLLG